MIVLGITGPTGSGKTSLLDQIRARGGCVLDLDAVYHGLLETDQALLDALDARFPGVIQNGALSRKALGNIVFADEQALADLDRIISVFIRRETLTRLEQAEAEGTPLAAIDAINLLEGDLPERCDATIAVTAPLETRVQRIMARDGITEEYARLRISAQKPSEYFEARCDYTICNTADSLEEFSCQCEAFLDRILADMKGMDAT